MEADRFGVFAAPALLGTSFGLHGTVRTQCNRIIMNSLRNVPPGKAGRVLVIGAGVSGLTSAFCLLRTGLDVTVLADRFAPQVTSVVAGALWEWPPAVCGRHHELDCLDRSKRWCETSYAIFADLANDPATGVFMRPVNFYFRGLVAEDERRLAKMQELRDKVRGFRHDSALIAENDINPDLGLRDAYRHLAPMIDTDIYMRRLLDQVRRADCRIVQGKVSGSLLVQEEALLRQYGADAIVNCAGLGAQELAEDDMFPVRGALVRICNDGKSMPRITQAHCISHAETSREPGFLFIVPRGDDMLVLGGIAEPDEQCLDIGLKNYEPIRSMYRRCLDFLPVLKQARIDAAEPVRVGLRPFRKGDVRLEREPNRRIVHNYGHGGSGVTYSWGCAGEVVELITGILQESRPPHDAMARANH
jgi:D-amino-acid oxidase